MAVAATKTSLHVGPGSIRRSEILQRLYRTGHVSVSALSADFKVSEMTIRRDLRQLTSEGAASLVHGGARLPQDRHTPAAFSVRAVEQASAKRRIGAAVVGLLPLDGTVGIDAGTTALEAAIQLPEDFRGTIVSHSVPVLATLLGRPDIPVIGLGGDLLHQNQAMVGSEAVSSIRNLRIQTFVVGASSIDSRGVYVHTSLELAVKQALIEAADEVILVCDASKQETSGAVRVCSLDVFDAVVVDQALAPELSAAIRQAGAQILIAL
ncbi:DeoR family transcriptional regulator [Glaciibacter superstes]|uniref:DeoR family transcriptional regulator n=1 Tax=Glaciibacter superstes TaxID=501023 RepID=UPI0003B74B4E